MIQIAPIPPISLIEWTVNRWPTQFLLLHEMFDYDGFKTSYMTEYLRHLSDQHHVILDNGAFELGRPACMDCIRRALDEMQGLVTELILPDRMFFMDETLNMSFAAYETLSKEFPNLKLMFVPHGRTHHEWWRCLNYFLKQTDGNVTIGIAKDYGIWPGGRELMLELVPHDKEVHFLGVWENIFEYKLFANKDRIRSCDTAKPFINAFWHDPDATSKNPRPENYFHIQKDEVKMEIVEVITNLWEDPNVC